MTTEHNPTLPSLSNRRYDIDAIRIIAFGLLILYHCAMFYVADWGWHIKSQYQVEWLQAPMIFLNQWRMPLLFVISGMATIILFQRYGAKFLGSRLNKLGIPLLFGMMVIVVPQAYFEIKSNIGYEQGYLEFWWQYLSLQTWPENAFAGSDFGVTWNHLWFLPYIMVYTIAFVPLGFLLNKYHSQAKRLLNRLKVYQVVLIPMLPLMLTWWFIFPLYPERTHALTNDWYNHGQSFTFFIAGALLMFATNIWSQLSRHFIVLLVAALVCFTVFTAFRTDMIPSSGLMMDNLYALFTYLNRWLWILVVMAAGYRFLNKANRFFSYATQAIFSWYILHQTITIVIAGWLSPLNLGGVFESSMVLLGTIGGCAFIHHFIILKLPFIQLFFGVKKKAINVKPEQDDQTLVKQAGV